MTVKLRQRQKATGISLYLDYYNKGTRQYEYLNLYLLPEPKTGRLTKEQKEENRKTLALAEAIRSKRHLELQNGIYGFANKEKAQSSFLKYFERLTSEHANSKGNFDNWTSTLKHLKKFIHGDITFQQITPQWLESWKTYLAKEAETPASKKLAQNSQAAYYSKVRAALKQALKEGIIHFNPATAVKGVTPEQTERAFLTQEELQAMAKAECDNPTLKKAYLFGALTGLRWSDIQNLKWGDIEHSQELGYFIRFRQQKTKGAETLPISEEAYKLLGEPLSASESVFVGLKYSAWNNLKLEQWAMRAGVKKHLTFHSSRHSNAVLHLTSGTDIYTISKMLGHKHVKTTAVYTHVVDRMKVDAANKIKIGL